MANADQLDSDGNGLGDSCDGDNDGDEVADESDNCPDVSNPDQTDSDGDGAFDGITRQFRDQYREAGIWSTGGNAVWTSEISPSISNRVLAGFDYSTEDALSLSASLSGTGVATARFGKKP